jgi:hypothetical protein
MPRVAAPVTDQESVVDCPAATAEGVAPKADMVGGGTTVTVIDLVVVPTAFEAVRVYVVVVFGYSPMIPFGDETVPPPLSMPALVK